MRTVLTVALMVCVGMAGYYFGVYQSSERASESEGLVRTDSQSAVVPGTETKQEEKQDLLVGEWRSSDDEKFTRVFNTDGSAIDRYQGNASATTIGSWSRLSNTSSEQAPFTLQPGIEYVKVIFPEEVLYFSISRLDQTTLEMVYLGVGETLRFTRRDQ